MGRGNSFCVFSTQNPVDKSISQKKSQYIPNYKLVIPHTIKHQPKKGIQTQTPNPYLSSLNNNLY